MIARSCGCQINVVSLNADRPLKNVFPYAMSKSALGLMTRSLAAEWGRYGVRVNALSPGFILTDIIRKLWTDPGMGDSSAPPAIWLARRYFWPVRPLFCDGQILYVDGGFTAGLGVADSGVGCLSVVRRWGGGV